jgi:hypothetical protein
MSTEDKQSTEPVEDLAQTDVSSDEGESVKGGFNPQPDPPRLQQPISKFYPPTPVLGIRDT